ncbi:hypothetical protein JOF56_011402 [Kibdelosporangium banguiense]|uniref:ESX secretion-associated protein EspG n=1 Tax=Kibdelosporangium banguiense TaxID=1365924 RepID=A0ABS4U2Y0_9PSEU|nr:ESX secretion-associated protein EspG [Kibdelosporangium banguiense]MBP2331017.1 hypothetical protein [Kibdelosporangium banguiense]
MSLDTLARLVRIENIGALPEVLLPAAGWQPQSEDGALDAKARDECVQLGWLDHRGRLDDEVVSALRVLCRASAEIRGWITVCETTIGVLAAAARRQALLAVRREAWVSVCSIRSAKLAAMAVAQTPDVPAGQGKPIRVRRSDALAFDSGLSRGLTVRPVPLEVRQLTRIAELPRTGAGEFHVATRDSMGRRISNVDPVGYVDTAVGRYVTLTSTVDDDTELLLAPTSQHDLTARLQHALTNGR